MRVELLEEGIHPDWGYMYEYIHGTQVGGSIFDENGYRHTVADLLRYAYPAQTTVYLHTIMNWIFSRCF